MNQLLLKPIKPVIKIVSLITIILLIFCLGAVAQTLAFNSPHNSADTTVMPDAGNTQHEGQNADGTLNSDNSIITKGTVNSYEQINIQNLSDGANSSSDVVATADNGSESGNFIDLGINGSNNNSGFMGNADDAYLYTMGNNFLIGTGIKSKALIFMTGGTFKANERMRIDGDGNVGVGTSTPTSTLQTSGSFAAAITTKTTNYTATANDYTILCNNIKGSITISIPSSAACSGRIYIIKKISPVGNNVVLQTNSTNDTIDGKTTKTITHQYSTLMLQSDGTRWNILSGF